MIIFDLLWFNLNQCFGAGSRTARIHNISSDPDLDPYQVIYPVLEPKKVKFDASKIHEKSDKYSQKKNIIHEIISQLFFNFFCLLLNIKFLNFRSDPDPFFHDMDPRIRIHIDMTWIRPDLCATQSQHV